MPLVAGDSETPLHWSGTAVDDEFVYFVSYEAQADELDLERVRKDGSGRERIASNISQLMQVVTLLVDERHVYIASDYAIARVAITGGMVEPVASLGEGFMEPAVTQDDHCLYYSTDEAVLCYSKSDGSRQRVLPHAARVLRVHGSHLYLAVTNTGPAFDPNGWIGRVRCAED
jgi:hypothetical protein